MLSKNLFLVFFLANTLCINVLAQTGFTTKSLVFFKNGTGFVTKSGVDAPKNNAYIWRDNLPKALYGTFWFNAEGTDIPSIRATVESRHFALHTKRRQRQFGGDNNTRCISRRKLCRSVAAAKSPNFSEYVV